MADFLTTSGTSHHIEHIIMNANKKLYLVSPYLQLSKTFYERLRDASNKGIEIKIIFGKNDLKPNEANSLANLKNVTLYFFENLHAKCYFNETQMVITSMNMYEFSEKNNREMGVLIDAVKDTALFQKAADETGSIMKNSEIISLNKTERKYYQEKSDTGSINKSKTPKMGYCIRCESRIPFNPGKPYCSDCFKIWAQYENPFFEENVCHSCGEFNSTTIEKPLCYSCYKVN